MQQSLEQIKSAFEAKRAAIIAAFEKFELESNAEQYGEEPGRVRRQVWQRPEGGGGEAGILNGRFFEKAAMHFSHVFGEFSEAFRGQIQGTEDDPHFEALGVSVIAHPKNPHAPTGHMNIRHIRTSKSWFGGGLDLSPMLASQRQKAHPLAQIFLQSCRDACSDPTSFQTYSRACDRYFHLYHRDEPRGIGGLFVDHLNSGDLAEDLAFMLRIAEAFMQGYFLVLEQVKDLKWTEKDRNEQLRQRGRYVEFNLLHDRGTLFGLKTGGMSRRFCRVCRRW